MDRKVTRVVEERSYGQVRKVYVSLGDLMSYFNCPCSYRQHGKQMMTEKVAWQMDLDSVPCAEGAAWKVTLCPCMPLKKEAGDTDRLERTWPV